MRRLVAIEDDNAHADAGKLFAVDPDSATGVPIPCWRIGSSRPAAGTVVGEAFLDTSTNTGWVWTANGYSPIVQSSILSYADDVAVFADNSQVAGAYGVSKATGNMFVMSATGWRQVGARVYATQAAANAETNVSDGALAWLQAEQIMVIRDSGAWVRLVDTPHISYGDVLPVAPVTGDLNYEPTLKLLKLWTGAAWVILPGMPSPTPNNGVPVVENGAWVVKEFNTYADNRYYNKAQADAKYATIVNLDKRASAKEYYYAGYGSTAHTINTNTTDGLWGEYCILDIYAQLGNNGSPSVYVEFNDGVVMDVGSTTNMEHAYNSVQYEAGGTRDNGTTFITNHRLRWCYRTVSSYDVLANHPLFATVQLFNVNGYWQIGWRGQYLSSNSTPMIFGGGVQYYKQTNPSIRNLGIRCYNYNADTQTNAYVRIHGRCK